MRANLVILITAVSFFNKEKTFPFFGKGFLLYVRRRDIHILYKH